MRIIELKASNIKKLKAVELKFDEKQNLVILSGKNGQGKSSVLDAIWWALGGTKNIQEKPIREGEESAESVVTLEAKNKAGEKVQYVVARSFTEKGNYLKVSNPDGSTYSNPQQFLDYIVGHLSFDPLEFSRFNARKQIEELKEILKLDFTKLDEKKKALTEERLLVGREGKALKRWPEEQIKSAEELKDKEEVSVSELSQIIQNANAERAKFTNAQNEIKNDKIRITDIEQKIKELEETKAKIKLEIEANEKIEDTKQNIEELQKSLNEADNTNKGIREAKQIIDDTKKIKEKEAEYKNLTEKIKAIDEDKAKQLSGAKLPIEGLSWDDGSVLYNNIPFSQISSGEQLRVSMAIAMASNPKLKMIMIKDGSLLDSDNIAIINEMVGDKEFTVFIEKVDDSGKLGIYLEEGEVKKIN